MKTRSGRGITCRLFVVLLAASTVAHAQTTPPSEDSRTPTAASALDDEMLTLDVFTVTGEQASGYRATNAITATGIGAKISDVPIPISVVTKELIQDASHFELNEALNIVPGVITNPRSESSFQVRGMGGNISYRNGMYRRQLLTTWNTDRVEVIKGPASIFFGAVRPGGIINYATSKPVFEGNFVDTKLTVGSHDYYRGEFYANTVLTEDVAVRIGAGIIDTGGDRDFYYKDEHYLGGSVLWKVGDRHQFTLDLETIQRKQFYLNSYGSRAYSNSQYLGSGWVRTTTNVANDIRAYLTSIGADTSVVFDTWAPVYGEKDPRGYRVSFATDARSSLESKTADFQYLFKISDNLVWQTDLNWSYDDARGLQPTSGETTPYANGSFRFRVEDWINLRDTYNIHNKLTWRQKTGAVRHTIQASQEYQHVIYKRPGYVAPNGTFNSSPLSGYRDNFVFGVDEPVSLRAMMEASGQTFNGHYHRAEINQGYFIVDQMQAFEGRLHMLAGARYNKFQGSLRYSENVNRDYDLIGSKGDWTPQAGALYKVIPGVSAYATFSNSIEPNFATDFYGVASEPVESESLDLGVKAELFGGRVTTTLAYYTIDRDNLAYRDTERELAEGVSPLYLFGNAETSEGFEIDLNWAVSDQFTVMAAWSDIFEARQTKAQGQPIDGKRFGYLPETLALWGRYAFTEGPLKGLALGLGMRHNSSASVSADSTNEVMNPAFTVWDLMVAYPVRIMERDVKVQLNVKNLTDELYRSSTDGFFNDRRRIYLSAQTRF